MLDPAAGWYTRGIAARMSAISDRRGAVSSLIGLFFTQTDRIELWETALTIERFGDRAAIRPLIAALYDQNPHRRQAAARALGWIPNAGRRAAKALIQALSDHSQPQPVREEAAESLAYCGYKPAIPPLIAVLDEPDVRIRFWSVFALGGIGQCCGDRSMVPALERMLGDHEVPPGNWWSVGREALAMLGAFSREYRTKLQAEIDRVLADPGSSPDDRRWAEAYDLSNL
jgi:HEAT repeat protein